MNTTEQMIESFAKSLRQVGMADVARTVPTPANWVAHAVARWRQGCTIGAPGECKHCNAEFLRAVREHLTLPERWVATGMMGGATYRSLELDYDAAQTTARQWAGIGLLDVRVERVS